MSAPKYQHPLNRLKSRFQNILPAVSNCDIPNVREHRSAPRIEEMGSHSGPIAVLSGVRDEHRVMGLLYGHACMPVQCPGSAFRHQKHSVLRQ